MRTGGFVALFWDHPQHKHWPIHPTLSFPLNALPRSPSSRPAPLAVNADNANAGTATALPRSAHARSSWVLQAQTCSWGGSVGIRSVRRGAGMEGRAACRAWVRLPGSCGWHRAPQQGCSLAGRAAGCPRVGGRRCVMEAEGCIPYL